MPLEQYYKYTFAKIIGYNEGTYVSCCTCYNEALTALGDVWKARSSLPVIIVIVIKAYMLHKVIPCPWSQWPLL